MFQHYCPIFSELLHQVLEISLVNKNVKMIPQYGNGEVWKYLYFENMEL